MSTLLFTIILSVILVILAILALAIGWIITGKVTLKRGSCGYDPTQLKKKKEECGTEDPSCPICGTDKKIK
jgi:hypothetical protein